MSINLLKSFVSKSIDPAIVKENFNSYLSKNPESVQRLVETTYGNWAVRCFSKKITTFIMTTCFSLGGLSMGMELPSKTIHTISKSFHAFRQGLDRLTDEERLTVLDQIPADFRRVFEKNWRAPAKIRVVETVSTVVTKTFDAANSLASYGLSFAIPRAAKYASRLISPIVSQEKQLAALKAVRSCSQAFLNTIGPPIAKHLALSLQDPIEKATQTLEKIPIVLETTDHIDHLIEAFAPRKLAKIALSSLVDFCRFNEATKQHTADPISPLSYLHHAASMGLFPSGDINLALQILLKNGSNPEQIIPEMLYLFSTALADADIPKNQQAFLNFCRENQLENFSRKALLLVENSYYIRALGNAALPEIRFLADLVLLDPKCALINIEDEYSRAISFCTQKKDISNEVAKRLKEHFAKQELIPDSGSEALALELHFSCLILLEDETISKETRTQLESFLLLAEGMMNSLFGPRQLLETVVKLHVKQVLYPKIIQCFLTPNGKRLLSALEKMGIPNLQDQLSTKIADLFVKKGLSTLTDMHSLSLTLLKLFNSPTSHLEDLSNKSLKYQAAELVALEFQKWSQSMSFGKQLLLGSTVTGLSHDLINLTTRADWGVWLLFLSAHLAQSLDHPQSLEMLHLTGHPADEDFCHVLTSLLPSLQWVPQLSWFLSGQISAADKRLDISIHTQLGTFQTQMQMQQLSARILQQVEIENFSLREIHQNLGQHIEETVIHVLGIDRHSPQFSSSCTWYLEFLLKASPWNLLEILRKTVQQPSLLKEHFLVHNEKQIAHIEVQISKIEDEIERHDHLSRLFEESAQEYFSGSDDTESRALVMKNLTIQIQTTPTDQLKKRLNSLKTQKNTLKLVACGY